MSYIHFPVTCYACEHRHEIREIKKPTVRPTGFQVECPMCKSVMVYKISVKGKDLKVETVHCSASEKGVELYEQRSNKKYEAK